MKLSRNGEQDIFFIILLVKTNNIEITIKFYKYFQAFHWLVYNKHLYQGLFH